MPQQYIIQNFKYTVKMYCIYIYIHIQACCAFSMTNTEMRNSLKDIFRTARPIVNLFQMQ